MIGQSSFILESPAFDNNQDIPLKYVRNTVSGGQNVSIPLTWQNAPEATESLVIAMIDRHWVANDWVHWMVINIPADASSIPEGASGTGQMPQGAKELQNTFGLVGYDGPQPPHGSGTHDYETTIYALNVGSVDLAGEVSVKELEGILAGSTIASARIVGRFGRQAN